MQENTVIQIESQSESKHTDRHKEILLLLNKWLKECAELSDLHFRYQFSCGKYSKMLLCFSVIFSTSVGISSFIQKEYWVSVLIGSFSLLSAILQSISKLFK